MRHLKVNSQKPVAVRRTIGTRNSKETASKPVQNDRNNIAAGKRIGTGTMPRTRRNVAQSNTPSTGKTTVTSSNQNKIAKQQNGNDQQRMRGEMESLLKKRNEAMPCMTGLDRVVNWRSSTQYAVVDYYKNEVVVSPRKQSVQRSSIQERISYDKVSSSSSYDFKVPSTVQRNENSVELIDLTDDASESNASSITTTQEELYSYLGVVTKSQTSNVETETENKTVKRSSLRVKVKQIALRNQEIYNQLENNRNLEAANRNALVRFNGHRIEQSSVRMRNSNGNPRLNQYSSKQQQQQQYTQSTYKSTTLVNNTTTNSQPSRNNYRRTAETSRVNQQQYNSSYQLIPYSAAPTLSRVRNSTSKCTVMERFVYKPDSVSILVNPDKYKTPASTSNTTAVNHITNGKAPHNASRSTKTGEILQTRRPKAIPSRDNRPPQISAGVKRKAMEQWIELSSTHPTSSNNSQSKSTNSSTSFTSIHHQNMTTTTTTMHRKIQKVDVSLVQTYFDSSSNTFRTINPTVSPQKTIQLDSRKNNLLDARATQNVGPPLRHTVQPNCVTKNGSPGGGVNVTITKSAPIQSPSLTTIRPSNALTLQTCSQKNIGNNNRICKRQLSPKFSTDIKKAIVQEAQSLRNVVVNSAMTQRKIQNVNSNNVPTGQAHQTHNADRGNTSSMYISPQKKVSSSATNTISPQNKYSNHDPRVSSSSMPVIKNVAVSNVSSLQTSSQQYISSNGKDDVTIEVTVQSKFNSKRAASMQLRTDNASSSDKNSQQNIDNKNVISRGNVLKIDSNIATSSVQSMSPVQNIVTTNPQHQNIDSKTIIISALKTEPMPDSDNYTKMQLIPLHHSMQNILLLPTSSMETKKPFQPPIFDIQSEIEITAKDLNENVAKDNKADIFVPIDLSSSINSVQTAKRDSKTNSVDVDVKPCVTITPIVREHFVNETDCVTESKSVTDDMDTNFLQKTDGDILSVLSYDDQFVVIQEKLISFWTLPCELFNIFGVAQRYVCTGKIERYNCVIEIDMPYQHRLLVVGNKTFYVELRAKKLSGTYTRESLMSIYLTLYSLNDQRELTFRHIEFDRVHGSIPSIRYTITPKSRSFVICWSEAVADVRKYNLNENMLNLESVLIFPGCREHLKKIQFFDDDSVIGFAYSTITIWDSRSGDITCKIDINTPIGDNLHFFSINENTERALFLIQSCTDPVGNGHLIKLLAVNMNKNYSWKVICTHKMPSNGAKIASMATIINHFITTYDNGESFLLNLYNPRQFVVHSSEAKGTKYFVTNDKVIAVDYQQLIAKTFVDHFFG